MIEKYITEIILGLVALVLFLVIAFFIQTSKIKKLKQKFEIFTMGFEGINLEKILNMIQNDIKDIEKGNILREQKISSLANELSFTIKKVGFVKYNAFMNKEMGRGGELSFSIAFLDGYDNGFVLSSIYTSQTSVCYAKPIKNKQSKIPLSEEEMLAIEKAIRGDNIE